MSDDLDFSELSDDQIVELAVALAREAMRRNPALQAAFGQALLDERSRVEAAERGTEAARRAEALRIEQQAKVAEEAAARERERQRVRHALASYLRAGAAIIGHDPCNLTLVWETSCLARGVNPRVRLSLGSLGARATWFLVDYGVPDGVLYTSPGMRNKQELLLPWCREVAAAITALGIQRPTQLQGIEL